MANRKKLTDEDITVILEECPSEIDTPTESSDESDVSCIPGENQIHDVSEPSTSTKVQKDASSSEDSDKEEPRVSRNFRKRDSVTTLPTFTLVKGTVQQFFVNKSCPTDIFLTVLSKNVIDDLLFQSNLYIQQKQRHVQPISEQEFYGFLGIQFLFGYHRLPQYRNYWCSDIDMAVPIVPQTMTKERFRQILSNLHINDNQNMPMENKDKLYKIRPIITAMNSNFQKFRLPDQFQSIDESMVRFKGRSSLKQYNPMKPIKRGYKLWCRADMSGYIYEFDIYQGKMSADRGDRRFGLGGSIVEKLSSSLHHNNYVLMMDNYFTSVELFEYLKTQGVYACGTIRPNRAGLPKLAQDKELKRGDFDVKTSEQGIAYFKWRDNRCVHVISNYHGQKPQQ